MENNTKKIFFVDDDADDQQIVSKVFQQLSLPTELRFFDSGIALTNELASLDSHQYPSLIVLDYNMPGWHGGETLQQLKDNPFTTNIPVVIYTSGYVATVQKETKQYPALLYLRKGNSYEKIREQVRFFAELIEEKQ